jgi:predicted ferric reductase
MTHRTVSPLALAITLAFAATTAATATAATATATASARDELLAEYATTASREAPAFTGISAARGESFHRKSFAGGNPDARLYQLPFERGDYDDSTSTQHPLVSAAGGLLTEPTRVSRHENPLALIITLVSVAWGWHALVVDAPAGAAPLWILRQQGLYLSGLLSIALMSLAMLLATRPAWLEAPLGGMDRVYHSHKWAGILALLIAGGVYGSVLSLSGRIGRSRQVQGTVLAVAQSAPDVVAVHCRLEQRWPGHRPGQFAFVSFADHESPHPFTIAGADRGDREICFQIRALGDYTRSLGKCLAPGQPVRVEGPYGRFDIGRQNRRAQQLWIAGGIGVTPFLAWLESLQARPADAPAAELHYCTGDRDVDPFVARLESLCTPLPGIGLQVHGARQGEALTADQLAAGKDRSRPAEVWFCGPQGFAEALQEGLRAAWRGRLTFHQEAFVMR